MKTNIKKLGFLMLILLAFGLTSCLEHGLDDLPAFDEAVISNIFIEHRYMDPNDKWTDGSEIVKFQRLEISRDIVLREGSGSSLDSVIVEPVVPAASGSFTEAERQNVTLNNLVAFVNISTAATIEPLDGAPVLGEPGDFSQPRKYRITAADGKTSRDWVILIKPLQY